MENILQLQGRDRADYIAEVLYARMEFEGRPVSQEEGDARIKMEIAESGWEDVTLEAVQGEIKGISGYMRDLGADGYIEAIRKSLRDQFGVKLPSKKTRQISF